MGRILRAGVLGAGFAVLAGAVLSASTAWADAGPTFFGDDWNFARINSGGVQGANSGNSPNNQNPIPISALGSAPTMQNPQGTSGICPWIQTGLNNFVAGKNGISGDNSNSPLNGNNFPTNQNKTAASTWNFTWAPYLQQVAVESAIKVQDYYPWVVNSPVVTALDGAGTQYSRPGPSEQGGAVFQMTFNPNAPAIAAAGITFNTLHTIQGLNAIYDDPTITPNVRLDNPGAHSTPYYDDGGAAGATAGGGGSQYFLDIPRKIEDEDLDVEFPNPDADVQFQVVIASDNYNAMTDTHNVTLYGGEWWGYQFYTSDTVKIPEPASLSLLAAGGLSLLLGRRRKAA